MSLDWSYISGCLLCIFKTELQMPQDGCYVPDLGKVGCSACSRPSLNLEARIQLLPPFRNGWVRPSFCANGFPISQMIHWSGLNKAFPFLKYIWGWQEALKQFLTIGRSVNLGLPPPLPGWRGHNKKGGCWWLATKWSRNPLIVWAPSQAAVCMPSVLAGYFLCSRIWSRMR